MKKNILVIAVIVLLLAGLTGCDDILEVFYPEFGETPNTIEVTIIVSEEQAAYPVFAEIRIMWSDEDVLNPYRSKTAEWNSEAERYQARFAFDVPDGEYTLAAWVDMNEDGESSEGEPFASGKKTYYEGENTWTQENFWVDEYDESYLTLDDIDFSTWSAAGDRAVLTTGFDRVIEIDSDPSENVTIQAPAGKIINYVSLNIFDAADNFVWWFDDYPGSSNWDTNVDFAEFTSSTNTGLWYFSFWIEYNDGSFEEVFYPINVVDSVNEYTWGNTWHIETLSSDWYFDGEPMYLDYYESYNVIVRGSDAGEYVFNGAINYGNLYIENVTPSNSEVTLGEIDFYYYGLSSPSDSYIEVIVDKNNNETADTGDWIATIPVGLDDTSSSDDGFGNRVTSFDELRPAFFVPYTAGF